MSRVKLLATLLLVAGVVLTACQDEFEVGPVKPVPPPDLTTGPRAQNTLLRNTERAQTGLSNAQQNRLSGIRARRYAAAVHAAKLATDRGSMLGEGREIGIDLSPTDHVVVILERRTQHESGSVSWHGKPKNGSGDFLITILDDVAYGHLMVDKYQWSIRALGGGLHAIIWIDPSGFGIEAEPLSIG